MSEQTNITIPANSNILEVLLSLEISYQALKERLFLRLSNKSILDSHENLYFRPYAKDMIISYHLLLSEGSGRVRSMPMTNALIEQFEIDTDDLHKLALANTERIWPCQIDTLTDTLQALGAKMERSDNSVLSPMDDMFTLSNISRTFGSSVILYPGVLAKASAKVGRSDLYLIPESVEGWLFGTVDNLGGHGHD